jgi:hypothetical protein
MIPRSPPVEEKEPELEVPIDSTAKGISYQIAEYCKLPVEAFEEVFKVNRANGEEKRAFGAMYITHNEDGTYDQVSKTKGTLIHQCVDCKRYFCEKDTLKPSSSMMIVGIFENVNYFCPPCAQRLVGFIVQPYMNDFLDAKGHYEKEADERRQKKHKSDPEEEEEEEDIVEESSETAYQE